MSVTPIHLRAGGTSVLLAQDRPGLPRIAYWGADLGPQPDQVLDSIAAADLPQRVSGGLDLTAVPSVVPLESEGWQYAPGLTGSDAAGRRADLRFESATLEHHERSVVVTATDPVAELELRIRVEVDEAGLLSQQLRVTNLGDEPWRIDDCGATFVLPSSALELQDATGRHLKERTAQRHDFTVGEHRRSSRRGRPGSDATLLLIAGEAGFGWRSGLCHGVTVTWSGNHALTALRTPTGRAAITAGELLQSGELILGPGEHYDSPVVVGSWGDGLDELASRFHSSLRARASHPRTPRPVTLNTWEAVYFDHDLDRLTQLADIASEVGVERFVLDDGWFLGRRDDTAGLGDWTVDPAVWPDGLGPLVQHVKQRNMQFGLWVEPEMVNPDSDLARAHPEWILGPAHRDPLSGRQQQVLNLADPDAYRYILDALTALTSRYSIDYLKWDHNRDLIEAIDRRTGRHAVHADVTAVYRLLDDLRARHPGLEIESCASGGARVDLGILQRTDRIWVSDCIDPLERLDNQAQTNLLVPYELMGMHLGAAESHSTFRTTSTSLQAAVAIFGHFGIERDLSALSPDELDEIRAWVTLHKRLRPLLHEGRSVHGDSTDPALDVRGVVSADRSHAVYALVQRDATVALPSGRVTLPGLDPDDLYVLRPVSPAAPDPGQSELPWTARRTALPGRHLDRWGVQAPVLYPASGLLIEAVRQGAES